VIWLAGIGTTVSLGWGRKKVLANRSIGSGILMMITANGKCVFKQSARLYEHHLSMAWAAARVAILVVMSLDA
jgi:hypothetical protein